MIVEHGALLGSTGPDRGLVAAVERGLGELGFAPGGQTRAWQRWPHSREGELEVKYLTPDHGAWACLGAAPAMARALAARLAARLQMPLQLFTATVRYREDEDDRSLEATVEDRVFQPEGDSAIGTFARKLEDGVRGDWGELCDRKSGFLIGSLLDAAVGAWVPRPFESRTAGWLPPASLGDRRLDELALRIRLAIRSELTTIDGRPCVRVVNADGGTTMSFLTPDELARLEPAVGPLMTR